MGCGLGPEPECRASQYTLRLLGRENGLGLLLHPQPLAGLVHETRPRGESTPLSIETPSRALTVERTLNRTPEEKRPDVRPQLREFLAWYEEVLGRIESGAVVAPGEQERLTEEASAVAHLLDLLDSSADEPAS